MLIAKQNYNIVSNGTPKVRGAKQNYLKMMLLLAKLHYGVNKPKLAIIQ